MKLPGFPERLNVFIEERRLQPYQWGTQDCVIFAADAVYAITGNDPISDLRGKWQDEATAMAVLAEQGGLVAAIDARSQFFRRRERTTMAQRGDLCLVRDANKQPSLAICTGAWCAAPGMEEVLMTPVTKARIVWEV